MNNDWMKLDNAAKIYPLVESDYNTSVFRFSATLDIEIKKDVLLKALNLVILRFPYYKVTLKTGFFWFYLEENNENLVVFEDIKMPCRRMIKEENNGYLFRVLYIDNKISIEFNHILADGTAGLIFLNTIVFEYLKLEGYDVSINEWIKDIESKIDEKEIEDSHSIIGKKYIKTHCNKVDNVKGVYHIKDRIINRNKYIITYGIMDSNLLHDTAKKYNCSITVFITAIYLENLIEIQNEQTTRKKKRKAVSVQVPVNMRKRLQSESMRNFSLYITPYLIPTKEYTFEDIIEYVKRFFEEKTDINNLLRLMVQNLKTEKSPFVRFLPLKLKTIITPFIYNAKGVDTFSGTISNMGKIQLPESIEKHVLRIDFILGPCPLTKCKCSLTGYMDKIYITFGRNTKQARVETKFFRKLVKLGVEVQIENQGGDIL
ncbi:MAG: hypothetical protein K0Q49_2033 [Haloplasmataceae bacterium]|jgi:NRPS condensation-like uncharacterized protein|nr:hypothetical protein [Haloplasmataceae bacterium]